MANPQISIIMTIYNHEKFITKSIKSVLNQSYKKWELIAIENGSKDLSAKILKSFKDNRIKKKFLKKNIGRTNALNLALRMCKGKFIAIQDSDDISHKKRLKIQLEYFKKKEHCWILGTNYSLFNKSKNFKKRIDVFKTLNKKRNFLFKNPLAHSTIMFRKDLIKKIGNYPGSFKYAQDYAFYLKAFKKYNFHFIKNNLVKINYIHDESETMRLSKNKIIYIENLKILLWVNKNFELSSREKFRLLFQMLNLLCKILLKSFNRF